MDLNELLASADRTLEQNRQAALHFAQVFLRMRKLPKPICGAGAGPARLRVAGASRPHATSFWRRNPRGLDIPEVQRGFVPAIVMTMLRRAVGRRSPSDLAATGRLLDGIEAAAVGLVSRVYEDADFEEQAAEALRVLAEASPSALAFTKQQFYQLDGLALMRACASAPMSTP